MRVSTEVAERWKQCCHGWYVDLHLQLGILYRTSPYPTAKDPSRLDTTSATTPQSSLPAPQLPPQIHPTAAVEHHLLLLLSLKCLPARCTLGLNHSTRLSLTVW